MSTDEDWSELESTLGGIDSAGLKLKETGSGYWIRSDTSVTNSAGFGALPGGRIFADGPSGPFFSNLGGTGFYWSPPDVTRMLRADYQDVIRAAPNSEWDTPILTPTGACTIRCVKD